MPRRRIRNEHDAARLLADGALRLYNGKMKAHDLHAMTSALSAYNNIQMQQRLESENTALLEELDAKLSGSIGAKIHYRKVLGRRKK